MRTICALQRSRSLLAGAAVVAALVLSPHAVRAASERDPLLAGMAPAEIMRLGENMYRNGILPSGEPVQAVVQGDIPVAGTMFTCANCHMRSGVGSIEGTIITPPTHAADLYRPRHPGARHGELQEQRRPAAFITPHDRPAYTDASLGHVLASGIDPAGDVLDPIMPRYLLEPRDMAIMVYYLKHLSAEFSPGASEEVLDFATIVAGDVSTADRDAMLMPLKFFFANRNARVRLFEGRKRSAVFAEDMDLSYRKLSLSVWELTGTSDTWKAQLEAHYRKKPVFAVLGGIVKGDFQTVHEFCNQNGIPCIMPVTDQPVVADDNWYVLYLSRGPAQEGASAARFLHMRKDLVGDAGLIAQVYRDKGKGPVIARAFRETLQEIGLQPPRDIVVKAGDPLDAGLLKGMGAGTIVALWLDADDLAHLRFADTKTGPAMVLASGGMLGERLYVVPDAVRRSTYITYPSRLPKDRKKIHHVVTTWLKQGRLPASNLKVSADVYVLGTLLTDVFMHMKRNFYRDHFLDVIDMQRDHDYTVLNYPRLSFGPGQRYASKGCYLVQLTEGPAPELVPMTDWVAH